jgi:hypothetical protein
MVGDVPVAGYAAWLVVCFFGAKRRFRVTNENARASFSDDLEFRTTSLDENFTISRDNWMSNLGTRSRGYACLHEPLSRGDRRVYPDKTLKRP